MKESHRRRLNGERSEESGDLADVNEQELAKDARLKREECQSSIDENIIKEIFGENEKPTDMPLKEETDTNPTMSVVVSSDVLDSRESREEPPKESKKVREKRKKRAGGSAIYVIITAACLVMAIGILLSTLADNSQQTHESVESDTESAAPPEPSDTPAHLQASLGADEIYDRVACCAVTVIAEKNGKRTYGSGTVLFSDGYVATLWDTVEGADRIELVLYDGSVCKAENMGGSSTAELALLKVDKELQAVSTASTETLNVGDRIYAIGALTSVELASSLCSGEIAFCQREISLSDTDGKQKRVSAIQTNIRGDGALGGCPVFNASGELVAMMLRADAGEAASFALPIEGVRAILEKVKQGEEPSRDVLSSVVSVTPMLGLAVETTGEGEACIASFSSSECDAAAKLRIGDIIVRIDQTEINNTADLKEALKQRCEGDTVEVFVRRDGQYLSFYVRLC